MWYIIYSRDFGPQNRIIYYWKISVKLYHLKIFYLLSILKHPPPANLFFVRLFTGYLYLKHLPYFKITNTLTHFIYQN